VPPIAQDLRFVAFPEIPGYALERQLGTGGMATVYLAVQLSLERRVAIKVLKTGGGDDDPERTEKRFLREGRTLAKLTHKNVCGIYDIAKVGDVAYIAMEYLDGGTLVDKLRRGVSVSESIAIVVQLASALDEAHKLGIVHRDLKPANVMLRGGRVPVLTDFGIARELTASQTRITAENMIVGTPIYMSPEQVSGGEVDGRSDLYSLGIMFYELLVGRPPYQGDTPIAVCMQHLTADLPKLPPDLADLQPVLDRMLAKRRDERFSGMVEFNHALRDVFIASEALRRVLRFAPDTPWSEQLRDLGFSFDTLRDADVKLALDRQRAMRTPGKVPPKPPAAAKPIGRRWMAVAATIVAVIVLGAGGWWLANRGDDENDLVRVTLLNTQLEAVQQKLNDGIIDEGPGNALGKLQEMRKIDADSDYARRASEKIVAALKQRAAAELAAQDLAALDRTLASMGIADAAAPPLTELVAQRNTLAQAMANQAATRERLARLEALLAGAKPNPNERLIDVYLELQRTLADDPELQKLQPRAQAASIAAIRTAQAAGQLQQALSDAKALALAMPQNRDLGNLLARLQSDVDQAAVGQALDRWRQQLAQGPVDAARLAVLIQGLAELGDLGLAEAERKALTERLQQSVLAASANLAAAGGYDDALNLLGQLLRAYPNAAPIVAEQTRVRAARDAALAAQRAAAERALQGQLAISTAPWSSVESIVDDAGRRVALPADASTPLVLTLTEGRYRVTLVGAGEERRQESVVVTRGKLSQLSLKLGGYDAAKYFEESGG
jgi:hypothetical protein